jgi:hypothetical protein
MLEHLDILPYEQYAFHTTNYQRTHACSTTFYKEVLHQNLADSFVTDGLMWYPHRHPFACKEHLKIDLHTGSRPK